MSKPSKVLSKEWQDLTVVLPDDLEVKAKEKKAFIRCRGIECAADLLRLTLMYAITLSLRSTALWATCLGLCDISRQAIGKRVNNSTAWLRYVLSVLLTKSSGVPKATGELIRRLILVDGSTIARPSSHGTEWRLHLSWQPFGQQAAEVTLTDAKEGESLEGIGLQEGDLAIADRGYAIWRNLKLILVSAAFFIFRLTWSNLLLQTPDGRPFDICDWLRSLAEDQEQVEITVAATNDPEKRSLRLVAGRLPPEKAKEARERVRRQARKQKREPHPNTLLAAGFCILLTNLPATQFVVWQVLALYRIRWQVEWCFRRWKSLCDLSKLPAYPAKIAEPVLLAKLILILLMQRHLCDLPWYEWWRSDEPAPIVSCLVKLTYVYFCDIIRPPSVLVEFLDNPTAFMRHLRSSHRKRPLQLVEAARHLEKLFVQLAPSVKTA